MGSSVSGEVIDGGEAADFQDVTLHRTQLEKIDGWKNWVIRPAQPGQPLTVGKIDGGGTKTFVGFGEVNVVDKIDGFGSRTFLDCGSLRCAEKNGDGDLFLQNTPTVIDHKGGLGDIRWAGQPPRVMKMDGSGQVISDCGFVGPSNPTYYPSYPAADAAIRTPAYAPKYGYTFTKAPGGYGGYGYPSAYGGMAARGGYGGTGYVPASVAPASYSTAVATSAAKATVATAAQQARYYGSGATIAT